MYNIAIDWKFVSPRKFINWNLIPNVVAFGSAASEKELDQEHRAHRNGISALTKRLKRASLSLPTCEDTVRKQWLMNQEAGSHQILNLLVP